MPESVVAEMVGLDSANALRTWQARQDLGVYMYGADVDRYDLDKTCYWLLGGTIKPTASSLGIKFHCHEQRTVVEKLEASTPAVNFIMGLHVGDVDGTLLDQVSKIIDLAYEYPSVFYIEQLVDQLHDQKCRVRHKDVVAQISRTLIDMTSSFILFHNCPTAPEHREKQHKAAAPPRSEAQKKKEASTQISYYEAQASGGSRGGRRAASTATWLSYVLMHEMMVSQVNQPKLLAALLEIWGSVAGFEMTDSPPGRSFSQNAMKLGSVLAQSIMGTRIQAEAAQKVQQSTSCVDGVSIGEFKGLGVGLTRPADTPADVPRRFENMRLGLIKLSSGSDEIKMRAIKENMSDIVSATNTINVGEDGFEQMEMYHHAMVVGATVNDHAESVVKNKYVPFLQKLLDEREAQEVASVNAVSRQEARHRAITFILCVNKRVWTVSDTRVDTDEIPLNEALRPRLTRGVQPIRGVDVLNTRCGGLAHRLCAGAPLEQC
jgi:hypothetical protein